MALFLHTGRNTELDGRKIPNGDNVYIEDDRDLDKVMLNKFKRVEGATGAQVFTVNDLEGGQPSRRLAGSRPVIDGGPSQPTAPNQSLDQNALNSGVKPLRNQESTSKSLTGGGPGGGGLQGTRETPDPDDKPDHNEAADASNKAARAVLTGGKDEGRAGKETSKKKKAAGEGEDAGWKDVTGDFDGATKADLCVVEYEDGGFQVFDADDKDNDDAKPLNTTALKTKKSVETFLHKYKK